MTSMYIQILNVIAPVALMTLVGYVLARRQVPLDAKTLSSLVLLVATPSLVFSTLTSLTIDFATMSSMALAAGLSVAVAAALGFVLLKVLGMSIQTFLPSLMIPNSGNIGLPLVSLAFGDTGLALGVSFFFVIALLQYTVGLAISSGQFRIGDLARQPLVYAVACVIVVTATGVQVPRIVASTTDLLGGMMIPAMLIFLGASLARLSVADIRPAVAIAFARLAIGLVASILAIKLLSLSGVEAGCVLLLAMMPAAIVTYVFAEQYRDDAKQVAGAIVLSTLVTFALLPAILWGAYVVSGVQL
ncbi:MAG: AEC family transporter [Rhodobacteraceae bacterium]|nr:AEC family transporter [Paracoccaceae bacterium]